jgi:hypothetical protein
MSRTIESSGAALAALCIAGVSSQANAATISVFLAHDSDIKTNIAIDSATPQFFYDSYNFFGSGPQKADFGTQNSGLIATSGNNGVAVVDPTLTYVPATVNVSKNDSLEGSGFVQLAFISDTGQEYGYASFNEFGDLVSITGDITSVNLTQAEVPLPASWALFTGGVAMLGLVAQRRRRRRKEAA